MHRFTPHGKKLTVLEHIAELVVQLVVQLSVQLVGNLTLARGPMSSLSDKVICTVFTALFIKETHKLE